MTITSNLSQKNYESLIEANTGNVARRVTFDGSAEGDSSSNSLKTTSLNPANTAHGALLQETITNHDFASDIDRYIDVEGVGTIAGTITKTGGTDAVTDTDNTTSQYFCVDLDAGDKFRLLGVDEGVLTLDEIKSIYK